MAKSSGSLDANVLVRLIIRDLPEQSDQALKLIAQGERFHVADTALIELIFALERYYEIPRNEVSKIIEAILGNSKLVLNRALFEYSIELYVRHPKLSIEDCCLAVYAKLNDATPLWTFDLKLAKQSGGLAKVVP